MWKIIAYYYINILVKFRVFSEDSEIDTVVIMVFDFLSFSKKGKGRLSEWKEKLKISWRKENILDALTTWYTYYYLYLYRCFAMPKNGSHENFTDSK